MQYRYRVNWRDEGTAPYVVYLLSFLCLVTCWITEDKEVHFLTGTNAMTNGVRLAGDAALILLPYWLLPGRFRPLVLVPLWANALWFLGSLWYFRLWLDLPPVSSLLLTSNVNGDLFKSAGALWQPDDMTIILFPAFLTLMLLPGIRKTAVSFPFPCRVKWTAVMLSLTVFVGAQFLYTRAFAKHLNAYNLGDIPYWEITQTRLSLNNAARTSSALSQNGISAELIRETLLAVKQKSASKHIVPGDEDKKMIEAFISRDSMSGIVPDSVRESNKSKNLILIIVESLNAEVLGLEVEGRELTPVLNSLAAACGSVTAGRVQTQVQTGGSGDGQLMANTGLLPLEDFSTAIAYGSENTFPSLCRALTGHANAVVFGDAANFWNEHDTFRSYGFEAIYTNRDYPDIKSRYGGDEAMFLYASRVIRELRQPFFLELLTVSMHTPFSDPDIPEELQPVWLEKNSGLSEGQRHYYEMTSYFDSSLGRFIDRLKDSGLYEDTILVIVSDHSQGVGQNPMGRSEGEMLFIAANTGITFRTDRQVGQIDVYPTILDLLGTTSLKSWRGAGTSILTAEPSAAGASDHDPQLISDLLLRSDYFK